MGYPVVVRVERLASSKAGNKAAKGAMKLLLEVVEAADMDDAGCRVNGATLKALGSSVDSCVRVSLVEALGSFDGEGGDAGGTLEERWARQEAREALAARLQEALAKLAHERDHYASQVWCSACSKNGRHDVPRSFKGGQSWCHRHPCVVEVAERTPPAPHAP